MAFHRKESPTQSTRIAALQESSLEVWGKEPRGSSILAVQAYKRKLPVNERGIEFETYVLPNADGHPHYASWSGNRSGILKRKDNGSEYVAIPVSNFINSQPIPEEGE